MSKAKARARPRSRDEIYAALVESRGIRSAFDRALAQEITDALVAGNLAEVVRALALLPPVVRVEGSSRTVSADAARAKLTELVLNAKAADQFEAAQAEQTEVEQLRAQVASLQDECKHLRGTKPRQLPPPSKPGATATKPAAATPKPAPAAAPPPSPTVSGQWDRSENGRAWHAWNAAGGSSGGNYGSVFSSDGLPVQGWLDQLNRREW